MLRTIRKYPNRRLYDPKGRGYITQIGLLGMIRDGIDVEILEHKTNVDVTGQVLLQALAESNAGTAVLGSAYLHTLIRGLP